MDRSIRVADELQQRLGIPVINIVDETAKAINAKQLKTVALLGTRYTMEMDFFKDRLRGAGINPIIPDHEDRLFIHTTIFDGLGRGELRPPTKARYLDIISKLEAEGAEGAILGCTEIPLLIKQTDSHLRCSIQRSSTFRRPRSLSPTDSVAPD